MKIGDIITHEGVKRKVIGFSMAEGAQFPTTEPYNGEEEPENEEEPVKEPVEKNDEPVKPESEVFHCQYCGREIKSKVGLASHEKSCKENPANK